MSGERTVSGGGPVPGGRASPHLPMKVWPVPTVKVWPALLVWLVVPPLDCPVATGHVLVWLVAVPPAYFPPPAPPLAVPPALQGWTQDAAPPALLVELLLLPLLQQRCAGSEAAKPPGVLLLPLLQQWLGGCPNTWTSE